MAKKEKLIVGCFYKLTEKGKRLYPIIKKFLEDLKKIEKDKVVVE